MAPESSSKNVSDVGGSHEERNAGTHQATSHSSRIHVSLTHQPIDVGAALSRVKDPGAGAVVIFAGCTRNSSWQVKQKRKREDGEGHMADKRQKNNGHEESERRDKSSDEAGSQAMLAAKGYLQDRVKTNSNAGQSEHKVARQNNEVAWAPVSRLTYSSYIPLALKTMQSIAESLITSPSIPPWSLSSHALAKEVPLEKSSNFEGGNDIAKISLTHRLGHVPVTEESILICVSSTHRQEAFQAGQWLLDEVKSHVEIWKREEFEDDIGTRHDGPDEGEGPGAEWRSNKRDDNIRRQMKDGAG